MKHAEKGYLMSRMNEKLPKNYENWSITKYGIRMSVCPKVVCIFRHGRCPMNRIFLQFLIKSSNFG